ncbi:MAG: ATP-sensitive inward rectifier potassium channel 10, partial [Alphaproteobacteria bacterium]|nr:ATP-sensitive inward rectifier potassium channel 10 [Alphaproteobacteria bacterium]
PLLALSWTVVHVIDETSPFYTMTADEKRDNESNLVISVHGYDKDAANEMHISKVYSVPDIKWDHSYVDIMSKREGNLTHVDFNRFHDVLPQFVEPQV